MNAWVAPTSALDALEATVGKTLFAVAVSDDGESTLRLTFAAGETLHLVTGADCCSESWWADVIGAASCYGAAITGARALELPDPGEDGRSRQDVDEVYGYALDTTAGTVTLAFRNSSNGYYGGWAEQDLSPPDTGWAEVTTNDWRP